MSLLHFGRKIYGRDEMTSTQDRARELAVDGGASAAGIMVMSLFQTAGRGRHGKTWHAPPGANVTHTYIGRPVALAELWQIAFVAGLAAADCIARFAPPEPVSLRFPNDVLISGKKVCGVLIETVTDAPDIPAGYAMPLIGIGINVLGTTHSLPPEVAVRATTIEAATGQAFAVGAVGGSLSLALSHRWNEWRTDDDGFATTLTAWHARHDSSGRRAFEIDGETVSCRVVSVTPDGFAVLELPNGDTHRAAVPQIVLG